MSFPSVDAAGREDYRSVGSTPPHARQQPEFRSRSLLVEELAQQLTRDSTPRLYLMLIVAGAGGAAFLTSVLMLRSDIPAFAGMSLRYGAAALAGYAAFVALIRLWMAAQREPVLETSFDVAEDAIDLALRPPPSSSRGTGEADVPLEMESTGGAARAVKASPAAAEDGGGWGFGLDLDDLGWLLLAGICICAGASAVVYVVYIAPVLLAEVALDAAIVSALYRHLRADEAGHWLATVLTKTWFPAFVVVLFAMIAGFALQMIEPEARSIGGVMRALLN